VIIRPPLVYGEHAPGNFSRLLKAVSSGMPFPFLSVQNQRSMISLDNLVDFIVNCIDHPLAGDQTFLVSDGEDVSLPTLVSYLAEGMGLQARLFPLPVGLIKLSLSLAG